MTVRRLIEVLSGLDQDKSVSIFWDGKPRGDVEGIYVDQSDKEWRGGHVVLVGDWCIYRNKIKAKHTIVYG